MLIDIIANLMYNQISHFSDSTMDSDHYVSIDNMTLDEVKIAKEQLKSQLRVDQEKLRREAFTINMEIQTIIAKTKEQGKRRLFEASQKMKEKEAQTMRIIEKLRKREQQIADRQRQQYVNRLIYPEASNRQIIVSERNEQIFFQKKLETHGIYIDLSKTNRATHNRMLLNPSQYSFRSVQGHKSDARSQTPKRK